MHNTYNLINNNKKFFYLTMGKPFFLTNIKAHYVVQLFFSLSFIISEHCSDESFVVDEPFALANAIFLINSALDSASSS